MLATPLGLRLDPARPVRDQIREAARLGAKGVVIDAVGDLAPDRLSETGRRELRHILRSVELKLVAVGLPTRRAFDTTDQLDDRLRRAESAYALAYELGTNLVVARVGGLPGEKDEPARTTFLGAVRELARRADHRGVRFGVETGPDPGAVLRATLESLEAHAAGASVDPAALLQNGHDPVATVRALGPWVVHAYATEPTAAGRLTGAARGSGLPPGAVDWEAYLGALEEVGYRGFLTVWPDPAGDPSAGFAATADRLGRL